MEHRWGNRIPVDIAVRISARPGMIGVGRILDLSVSGAWIAARLNLPVLARVMIVPSSTLVRRQEALSIEAYVSRTSQEGFGVEWHELDPPAFSELLHPHAKRLMADLSSVVEVFEPPPS